MFSGSHRPGEKTVGAVSDCRKKCPYLRAERGNSEGGLIAPLGTRDSATTGHCVVPVRGLYNPLGPEYTIQDWAGREDGGGTTTHGVGICPGEGV